MKSSILIGVVALVVGILPAEAWARGLRGHGGFRGGFHRGGSGVHGHFGRGHGGFGQPRFHSFDQPRFHNFDHFGHFQHGLFFDPFDGPDGLLVVVINAPAPENASVPPCGPGTHWEAARGRCQPNRPRASAPPAGVIVLRPEGRQELATACPQGFIEQIARGWRFCLDPQHLEPVSPLRASAIAGIPYEEAVQILQRHQEELLARPGVKAVGLERGGLYVEAELSAELPTAVEGLPLAVHPWRPWNLE